MLKKEIIIDNFKINYYQSENFDKDKAIVFLHGWGTNALSFKNILKRTENFIALDWPGFGGSERPNDVWGVEDYSLFLKSFLAKLDIKNPILAGHSFGGSIIIKYASLEQDIKKIILIGSAGIREQSKKVKSYRMLAKIIKPVLALPGINLFRDKIRKAAYEKIDSIDYLESGEMREIYKKIIKEDLREDMEKIKIKTILIWGEDDKATPIEQARKMNELISDSKLNIIKNAGHYVFWDKEEEFMRILNEAIR